MAKSAVSENTRKMCRPLHPNVPEPSEAHPVDQAACQLAFPQHRRHGARPGRDPGLGPGPGPSARPGPVEEEGVELALAAGIKRESGQDGAEPARRCLRAGRAESARSQLL